MLPRLELGLSPAAPKNGMAEDDGRSKRNDDEEDDSKSYSDMEVVAIVGLEVPSPWMVLPSKHYAGRHFFKNIETSENRWTLPSYLFQQLYSSCSRNGSCSPLVSSLATTSGGGDGRPIIIVGADRVGEEESHHRILSLVFKGGVTADHDGNKRITDHRADDGGVHLGGLDIRGPIDLITCGSLGSSSSSIVVVGSPKPKPPTTLLSPPTACRSTAPYGSIHVQVQGEMTNSVNKKGRNDGVFEEVVTVVSDASSEADINNRPSPPSPIIVDNLELIRHHSHHLGIVQGGLQEITQQEHPPVTVTPTNKRNRSGSGRGASIFHRPNFLQKSNFKNIRFPSWQLTSSMSTTPSSSLDIFPKLVRSSICSQEALVPVTNHRNSLDTYMLTEQLPTPTQSDDRMAQECEETTSTTVASHHREAGEVGLVEALPLTLRLQCVLPPLTTRNSEEPLVAPKFKVLQGLGHGGYSTVVLVEQISPMSPSCSLGLTSSTDPARLASCGSIYAMKVIPKIFLRSLTKRKKHQLQVKTEIKILSQIVSSPFLEQCHAVFESYSSIFLVIDFIDGGDMFYHLKQRLEEDHCFSIKEGRFILAELFSAIEHLHSVGYVHRDIKIENVMLTREGHVKVVDFGLAVEMKGFSQTMTSSGSLIYMAPERLTERTGGRHTDWWSFGVLAHELLTGKCLWSSLDDTVIIKAEIKTKSLEDLFNDLSSRSRSAGAMIRGLLCRNVNRRLGSMIDFEVKNCSFFCSIDFKALSQLEIAPVFVPSSPYLRNNSDMYISQVDQDRSLELYNNIMHAEYQFLDELTSSEGEDTYTYDVDEDFSWSLGLPDASQFLLG